MIEHKQHSISTNDDARDARYDHFDAIWAEHQSAGRGQRGHVWHSREGENLTFSVVLKPHFLPIVEQFLLSEVVALALVETLGKYGIECRIKWTNDIYAGDKKIVGVLIEQSLSCERIERTIVGVGINVNQRSFPEDLPNPTSMYMERGREFDREEVLREFINSLRRWYDVLERGDKETVQSNYRKLMYRLDEAHTYYLPTGEAFTATIRGVRPSGQLCLEHSDGLMREYAFKEVEFKIVK